MIPKFSHPQKHWLLRRKVWDNCHWSWRIHGNKSRAREKFLQFYWMETPWEHNWSPCCGFLHLQFFRNKTKTAVCVCTLSCFICVQLFDPVDCSLTGFYVHGILQARILEWVAMPSSRGSSGPKDQTRVSYISCIGRWAFYHSLHLEAQRTGECPQVSNHPWKGNWIMMQSKELLSYEDLLILVEWIWQETI